MRLEFTLANWKLKIHLSIKRISVVSDIHGNIIIFFCLQNPVTADDTLRFQMRDTGDGVVLKGIPRILACVVFCDEITGSCHNKNDDADDQSREKSHLNMKSVKHEIFTPL